MSNTVDLGRQGRKDQVALHMLAVCNNVFSTMTICFIRIPDEQSIHDYTQLDAYFTGVCMVLPTCPT